MHRARLVGIMFLIVGLCATAALMYMPPWLPLPRFVAFPGPVLGCLGLAMTIRPGPHPQGEGFDFEDWFDECSLGTRALYLASALAGLALAIYLFATNGWLAAALEDFSLAPTRVELTRLA